MRYTAKDVMVVFGRLQAIYPDAANWTIQEGTPSAGREWRMVHKDPNGDIKGFYGYLGWTAREAHLVLNALISGIMLERDNTSKSVAMDILHKWIEEDG